jgi:hypothetical protein
MSKLTALTLSQDSGFSSRGGSCSGGGGGGSSSSSSSGIGIGSSSSGSCLWFYMGVKHGL